jgi:Ca-activated chloride channel family protein
MLMTPLRPRATALLALSIFLFIGIVAAQDKPDRPPWAQKSKSSPNSAPTPVNTSAPASSPAGEPGKIIQPTPPSSADDSQDPAKQHGTIKVRVNLVNVLASVLDEKNRPAPDLPKEAFQLFEEGVQQEISVFEPETSQPLDLALMIDASLSAHKEISFEQEAAAHFIRQVLRPGDRLSVFSFDEDVHQRAAFSDNVADLQAAVRKIPDGAGTSIYDAVVLGSGSLAQRGDERRRVIIMVTDAGETTSRSDFEAARKAAVRSNALLYTIVIRPVKNESGRNTAGEHALETMTDTTGGAMFYPDNVQDLPVIFDRIDRELRTQYRLAYYPNPRGPANTYRSIVVTVSQDNYKVRHRRSYLTGPQ